MKKEILLFVVGSLFLLAYVLDYLAGPVTLRINHPIQLTNYVFFTPFPLTSFAILIRAISLMLTVVLFLSLMEYQYFKKSLISLFLGFIAFIYGYQQIVTLGQITPELWTIAIIYGSILLIIPITIYILLGIYYFLIPPPKQHIQSIDNSSKPSVLDPQK